MLLTTLTQDMIFGLLAFCAGPWITLLELTRDAAFPV
jgi:hypothetical protein